MLATVELLKATDFPRITRKNIESLQVNLGYLCNQSCVHCHVNAGPRRKEIMTKNSIDSVIRLLEKGDVRTLDLTGGAPEMNPHFRHLVQRARALGVRVIDRCNLTILQEDGYAWLADFLARHGVEVVASLPCYLSENVDAQRGNGVFDASIAALKKLNALGHGRDDSGLSLTLVYNPQGANLPPAQASLEAAYKRELDQRFGIHFNQLFTITNMPIQRFGSWLLSQGLFADYMQTLKQAYNPMNLESVMCRSLLSVDWQGYIYDCDFNQMLGLPVEDAQGNRRHLDDLMAADFCGKPIVVMDHCYGCTAGSGSSCGGALA
ncbi:MAG: radical SAM protein [Zetaproteobacteria bacterium CG_4_9_14_3_um_filter_49_83]|nr:MAG: radical SAM protein [Zetaproteobacteria bacterium CG1_02_49_23]PIQ32010.1 MAG: radical SAM protein [Zetaproteobacteria bacterium CG17_big_fil_post_rev_8_21_14_2_50_50_13]PIV31278.1 MAG: radical SAM protein [Zetaproteobacteria bacterium CG02_land_8_20_14_3_00_50_9]PIY56719.1 MAG: radical SAM protein [Zetaproteobacteria bacterium CG_4_10_14_0_8_um_filter_49_80]PJA36489.1 MAG: radical SAM protein [Zetaproteobacteria bacterium CG_4_9_14_3_um_filter_49_83]